MAAAAPGGTEVEENMTINHESNRAERTKDYDKGLDTNAGNKQGGLGIAAVCG